MTHLLTKSILASLLISLFSAPAIADNSLKTLVRTTYPDNVSNSRYSLIKYILGGTGYKVYLGSNAPSDAESIVFDKSVPLQKKGLLTNRRDALLMVTGDETVLIIDEKNKLISFTKGI